jgi:hypothetical protein
MTKLSPLDALGPAFRRTREVMARPFRLGFFLKIALIAALTQPAFYSSSISYPFQGAQFAALRGLGHRSSHGMQSYGSGVAGSGVAAGRAPGARGFAGRGSDGRGIAGLGIIGQGISGRGFDGGANGRGLAGFAVFGVLALIVAALVGVLLWIGIAYLYCRLRFTLFDLVVYKRGRVRQAWSGYGRRAWRYFGLALLVGLGFMAVSLVVIGPALLNFIRNVVPLARAGTTPDPFAMLGSMLPFLLSIFVVALLWAVVDALMQDFLLPPMAVEDAPLESAFGRFFRLLRADFGSVAAYVLLRFVVGIGLTWVLMLLVLMALLLAGLAVFGVGLLLYHLLWASLAGKVICVALALAVGLAGVAVYLMALIAVYGISAVFKQSYAAYFFGGRYPELGDLLEPPPQLVEASTEVSPPPALASPSELPPLGEAPPVW